jgi:capsular exopolysaccharide synthesis family protein
MHFLACGPIPPNPSELLGSDHAVSLIEEVRKRYDLVIIDTAPLLPVTDGAITAARADGAVVVVRYGRTRTGDVERALESLRAVDARVLGTVLNRAPVKGQDSHSYEGTAYASVAERRKGAERPKARTGRSKQRQAQPGERQGPGERPAKADR